MFFNKNGRNIFGLISGFCFYISVFLFALAYLPFSQDGINFAKEYFLYSSLIAICLPFLLSIFFKPEFEYKKSVFDWPVIILCLYFLFNTFFSQDAGISLHGKTNFFLLHSSIFIAWGLWYISGIQIISTQKIWSLCKNLLLWSSIVLAIIYFLGSIGLTNLPLNLVAKNNSLFGVYLSIILIINFGLLLSSKKTINTIFYLIGAVSQATVMARLGFSLPWIVSTIGLALVIFFFLFKLPKFANWKFICVLTMLVISLLFAFFGVLPSLKARLPVEVSLGSRASWNIVSGIYERNGRNLLIGTGAGTFPYNFAFARGREFNLVSIASDTNFQSPYSTIYGIMSELGIIGLLIFLSFLAFGIGFIIALTKESSFWMNLVKKAPNLLGATIHIDQSLSLRKMADEYNENNDKQDRFHWEVIVVSCAWLTLTITTFFTYFEMSLWWLWWFLLLLLGSGINLLSLNVILKKRTALISIQSPYSTVVYFANVAIFCCIGIGIVYGIANCKAEVYYTKSISTADINEKEELLLKAIGYRDGYAPYRLALSQIQMLKAASLTKREKTDNDKLSQSLGQAISEAKTAVSLEPKNYKNWENLATIYLNAAPIVDGASDWAIDSFNKVIEQSPSAYTAYLQLANSYIIKENYKEAEKNYLLAIEMNVDFLQSYNLLADLYAKQGELDKAIAIYQPVLAKVVNDPDSVFRLGMLFFNKGGNENMEKAKTLFSRAIELRPDFSNALFSLALVYEKNGDYKDALSYYQKVSALNPDNKDIKIRMRGLTGQQEKL